MYKKWEGGGQGHVTMQMIICEKSDKSQKRWMESGNKSVGALKQNQQLLEKINISRIMNAAV